MVSFPTVSISKTVDAKSNLYGTTSGGGDFNHGTIFKIDKLGNESVLHSFTGAEGDGENPNGDLLLDSQSNIYGTTSSGGAMGVGTVFKVDALGNEIVIHSFCSGGYPCVDGVNPYAGLIQDPTGILYGTTWDGGVYGHGTVFKIDPAGNETVLNNFSGAGGDGANPYAGVVLDAQGNLYGTTVWGGASGCGTVFKLTPSAAATKTTTTLLSAPDPSVFGQLVTFVAKVTSSEGAPPDGELLGFVRGTTLLGSGVLSGGSANFTTTTLPTGNDLVKAVYYGDSNFLGSMSKTVKQVVNAAKTTTTLISSQNPSQLGQSVNQSHLLRRSCRSSELRPSVR
jgi:uncharacterized repeat protein (TIGR03803 family)